MQSERRSRPAECTTAPGNRLRLRKVARAPDSSPYRGVYAWRPRGRPHLSRYFASEVDLATGKRRALGYFDTADDAERARGEWAGNHLDENRALGDAARRALCALASPPEDLLPATTGSAKRDDASMVVAERAAGPALEDLLEDARDALPDDAPGARVAKREILRWRGTDARLYADALELGGGARARHRRAWERALPAVRGAPSLDDDGAETADRLARWSLRRGSNTLADTPAAACVKFLGAALRRAGLLAPDSAVAVPDGDAAAASWALAGHAGLIAAAANDDGARLAAALAAAATLSEHARTLDGAVTVSEAASAARLWRRRRSVLRVAQLLADSPLTTDGFRVHIDARLEALRNALQTRAGVPVGAAQASASILVLASPSERLFCTAPSGSALVSTDAATIETSAAALRAVSKTLSAPAAASAAIAFDAPPRALVAWSSNRAAPWAGGSSMPSFQSCVDVLIASPSAACTPTEAVLAASTALGSASTAAFARAPQLLSPAALLTARRLGGSCASRPELAEAVRACAATCIAGADVAAELVAWEASRTAEHNLGSSFQ